MRFFWGMLQGCVAILYNRLFRFLNYFRDVKICRPAQTPRWLCHFWLDPKVTKRSRKRGCFRPQAILPARPLFREGRRAFLMVYRSIYFITAVFIHPYLLRSLILSSPAAERGWAAFFFLLGGVLKNRAVCPAIHLDSGAAYISRLF